MLAAAWIKGRIAIWARIAARHVLRDAQLISAGAAEHRRLVPFRLQPDLDWMSSQSLVTLFASVMDAAALHLDGDDVEFGSIVSAARHGVEINAENLRARKLHR